MKKAFKTDYHVKTIEQVYSLNKEYKTCYLLTPSTLLVHRKEGHNYLHIGLVQVRVKPHIREWLNWSILIALRDTRHIRFDDSFLRTIETTPPDLQYEERNVNNQFLVSSAKLYEWNIDGLSEQEILNKIQHMSMVANNYLNENRSHVEVIELMVLGLTWLWYQKWGKLQTKGVAIRGHMITEVKAN